MSYIVGVVIGLVLGLTGAGGSVLAVPMLMGLLALPAQQAMGISLGAVCISALYGVLIRLKNAEIQWLPAWIFAVVGALFSPLGVQLNQMLDEQFLMLGFSLLVLVVASKLWRDARVKPQLAQSVRAQFKTEQPEVRQAVCRKYPDKAFTMRAPCALAMLIGAALTGVLSGLFGVGGGFLIVPILLFLTQIAMYQAVATSLLVISIVSLSGFVSFLLGGVLQDYVLLGEVALGGVIGMSIGLFTSRRVAGPRLQQFFAGMMFLIAGFIIWQNR